LKVQDEQAGRRDGNVLEIEDRVREVAEQVLILVGHVAYMA